MMDHRTRHLDSSEHSARIATQAYLLLYISDTSDICQNLLDSVDGIVNSIKDQETRITGAEDFLTLCKTHGKSSITQLGRVESLAKYIRNADITDIISALYSLRLSFDRLQAILALFIQPTSGLANWYGEPNSEAYLTIVQSKFSHDEDSKMSSHILIPNFVFRDLDGAFETAVQRFQDHVLFLSLEGQLEFRASMTHLLLWTAYESELFHNLLAKTLDGSISLVILFVIRMVLLDPSRLSRMQQRMIDANCLRRGRLIKAKINSTQRSQVLEAHTSEKAKESENIKASYTRGDPDSLKDFETTKFTWNNEITKREFTSTYVEPYRLTTITGNYKSFPRAPKAREGASDIVCPFCHSTLPASVVRDSKKWRLHVLQDVLPYTCIFETCLTPSQFYPSATNWLAHMEQEHSGRQWICYGCSPSEPRIFDKICDYIQHFGSTRQHAGVTTAAQIESLAQLDETPLPLKFTGCPLCRWSEYSEMNSFFGTTMQDHVADHLLSFAMWSLPLGSSSDSGSEYESEREGGYGSEESDQAVDGMSERSFEFDSLSAQENYSNHELDERSEAMVLPEIGTASSAMLPFPADSVIASFTSRRRSRSSVPMLRWRRLMILSSAIASFLAAGRRIRSKSMCDYCLPISNFFQDLNINEKYKIFKYHHSRKAIYMFARAGCSLCKMFIRAAFGKPDQNDYELSEAVWQSEGKDAFSIVFSGWDKKKSLQMWEGPIDNTGELLCEFEIYCTRYDALSTLNWTSHRPLFMDPSSEDTLDFLREHLEFCAANHKKCRPQARVFPTRLIDVRHTIRLIDRPSIHLDPPKFLYLSACWGSDFALRLTHNNEEQLKTEIMLEDLPRTVRDAIVIAKELNVPYIWVDSLCIFQDDLESWNVEVLRMKDYLRSCTFTLGVASSQSLAAGFLDLRDDRRCYTFNARTIGSLPGAKVHLRPSLPSVWDSLSQDPLLTRLWPLQELTLCSRSILFGSSRIVWNCRTHMISDASEDKFPSIWNQQIGFDVLLDDSIQVANETSPEQGNFRQDFSTRSKGNLQIYNAWHRIVEISSQRKVTFERDRLPALAGLASVFQEKLNGDEYVSGLWKKNLYLDLLWHRTSAPLRRISDDTIPSWTWAAYAGRISYSIHDFKALSMMGEVETDQKSLLSIAGFAHGQQSIDAVGECKITNISIDAYSIDYNLFVHVKESELGKMITWEELLDSSNEFTQHDHGLRVQSFKTEVDSEINSKRGWQKPTIHALDLSIVLIAELVDQDWNAYMALVVEKLGGDRRRRVGVGVLLCPPTLTYRVCEFSQGQFRLV